MFVGAARLVREGGKICTGRLRGSVKNGIMLLYVLLFTAGILGITDVKPCRRPYRAFFLLRCIVFVTLRLNLVMRTMVHFPVSRQTIFICTAIRKLFNC